MRIPPKLAHFAMSSVQTLVLLALFVGGVLVSFFGVAIPSARLLLSVGFGPWISLLSGTAACALVLWLLAWKVYLPYINWLEPRLRGNKPWRA